jgi:hypothetical protein
MQPRQSRLTFNPELPSRTYFTRIPRFEADMAVAPVIGKLSQSHAAAR